MQFYYGTQMPLRVLDECEFWKEQEEEHTVVIRELVSGLEQQYVKELRQWEHELARTHQRVVRFIETTIRSNGVYTHAFYRDFIELVSYCLGESHKFIDFCNKLLRESQAIQNNPTAGVVLKHIIDESEYFMGIAQTVLYQTQ